MKKYPIGQTGIRRVLPVLGVFAGGMVHSCLPRGHFGTYDMFVRAAITGTVAGITALALLMAFRPTASKPEADAQQIS